MRLFLLNPCVLRIHHRIGFPSMVAATAVALLATQAGSALADGCDVIAARIAAQEGATVNRRTEADIILMRHVDAAEVSVGCSSIPSLNPDLFVGFDGAYPSARFYDFVSRVGAIVTGAPSGVIREGAPRCQQAALRAKDEFADLAFGGITFECHAFARDGGGTAITIYRKTQQQRDEERR